MLRTDNFAPLAAASLPRSVLPQPHRCATEMSSSQAATTTRTTIPPAFGDSSTGERHLTIVEPDDVDSGVTPRQTWHCLSDRANLDEGRMWPTTFALKELTAADEARFGALVKKAAS
jgi:hypothetical protein